MHIIPANDEVKNILGDIKKGNIIEVNGYLVNVQGSDGYLWESSMTRSDTGDGACELIFAESISIKY